MLVRGSHFDFLWLIAPYLSRQFLSSFFLYQLILFYFIEPQKIGFLPAEYSEADRVPVLARWQVPGHPA